MSENELWVLVIEKAYAKVREARPPPLVTRHGTTRHDTMRGVRRGVCALPAARGSGDEPRAYERESFPPRPIPRGFLG